MRKYERSKPERRDANFGTVTYRVLVHLFRLKLDRLLVDLLVPRSARSLQQQTFPCAWSIPPTYRDQLSCPREARHGRRFQKQYWSSSKAYFRAQPLLVACLSLWACRIGFAHPNLSHVGREAPVNGYIKTNV